MSKFTHVVFIEDEEIVLDSFKFLSEEHLNGICLTKFFDCGDKAFEHLDKNRQSTIVVSDNYLPGKNGTEIANLLNNRQNIKLFVLLSGEQIDANPDNFSFPVIKLEKPLKDVIQFMKLIKYHIYRKELV